MASTTEPRIYTFLSDGAIAKGKAVKMGTDKAHVAIGAANTNRCVGLIQNDVTAAEQHAEVALQGGGAKGLLGETVAAGDDLVSHTDGTLVKPNAAGDAIVARAMEAGVVNQLIAVEVYYGSAHAAQ